MEKLPKIEKLNLSERAKLLVNIMTAYVKENPNASTDDLKDYFENEIRDLSDSELEELDRETAEMLAGISTEEKILLGQRITEVITG